MFLSGSWSKATRERRFPGRLPGILATGKSLSCPFLLGVIILELMRSMRAEDEFELKEHRIHIATGQEECLFEKIVVVLKPEF